MKETDFLQLKKPDGTDFVDIEVLNENADIIDAMAFEFSPASDDKASISGGTNGTEIVTTQDLRQVNASYDSRAGAGTQAQVNASNYCETDNRNSVIIASRRVKADNDYEVIGGYGSGEPSTSNITWRLNSQTGVGSFYDVSLNGESLLNTINSLTKRIEAVESLVGRGEKHE